MLSIGIVVDDAIVVIEAIHEKMHHTGLTAKQATVETMGEITGAILSITMVMAAVFLPVGFMQGPSGIFYQQFAYTRARAMLISAGNALTFTPALCALFFRRGHSIQKDIKFKNNRRPKFIKSFDKSKKKFFKKFNLLLFDKIHFYVRIVQNL